jgi:hypothetical protein
LLINIVDYIIYLLTFVNKVLEPNATSEISVSQQSAFTKEKEKSSGRTTGYFARLGDDQFLLKHFFKSDASSLNSEDDSNRLEAVQELVASRVFALLLGDRVPEINLVKGDEGSFDAIRTNKIWQEKTVEIKNKDSLYISSKLFENVKTLKEIIIDPNTSKEYFSGSNYQVRDLEKVIAACNICGDADYFFENLMLQQDKDNPKEWNLLKIDHGKSLIQFQRDFTGFIDSLGNQFERLGYNGELKAGRLKFDADKYNTSLKQMLEKLDGKTIDKLVDEGIDALKKGEFDDSYFWKPYRVGNDKYEVEIESFGELADVYKDLLKRNVENLRVISKSLDVVTKFSGVSEEFKNGGWIEQLAGFPSTNKDPILFAAASGIKIYDHGKSNDALEWAKNQEYLFNTQKVDKQNNEKIIKREGKCELNHPIKETVSPVQEFIKTQVEKISPTKKITNVAGDQLNFAAHITANAKSSGKER